MKKKLEIEDLTVTEGPMNAVALETARAYLGLQHKEYLTPEEERSVRAKKKKIVVATKKMDRRVDREISRRPDCLK